jgi:hypothetical protein
MARMMICIALAIPSQAAIQGNKRPGGDVLVLVDVAVVWDEGSWKEVASILNSLTNNHV